MSLTASAGVGTVGMTAAPAAGHVAIDALERAEAQAAPLPDAPAAVPVVVALHGEDGVAPSPDPEPERLNETSGRAIRHPAPAAASLERGGRRRGSVLALGGRDDL